MEVSAGSTVRGVCFGLGTALAFPISPVFVRLGLANRHTPAIGLAVGITAAWLAYVAVLALVDPAALTVRPTGLRRALRWESAAAVSIVAGTWMRYVAMDLAPLAFVSALGRVNILVILLLAAKSVTWRVWLGAALIIIGSVLLVG